MSWDLPRGGPEVAQRWIQCWMGIPRVQVVVLLQLCDGTGRLDFLREIVAYGCRAE